MPNVNGDADSGGERPPEGKGLLPRPQERFGLVAGGQLGERFSLLQHNGEDLKRGKGAVARGRVLQKNEVTGLLAANIVGRKFIGGWESLMDRIPVARLCSGSP